MKSLPTYHVSRTIPRAARAGQSLIEILVAIAIGALLIGAAAAVIVPALTINNRAVQVQTGATLAKQLMDNVRVWSEQDWHNVLSLPTGTANTFYLNTTSSPFSVSSGEFVYERPITVNYTYVSSTFANFPILFSGTYAYLAASSLGGLVQNPNGYDVSFAQDAGCANRLTFQTDSYVSSTGFIADWVQIPTLSNATNTVIYLCYDGPTVRNSQSNTAVWSGQGLAGYWQMDEGSGSTTIDFSGNGNNGTWNGGSTYYVAGKIGSYAGNFDGSSNWVNEGNGSTLNQTTALTVSAWINIPSLGQGSIMSKWGSSSNNDYSWLLFYGWFGSGRLDFLTSSNGNSYNDAASPTGTLAAGGWYHVVGVYSGASTTATLYVNGQQVGTSAAPSSLRLSTTSLSIGVDHDNGVGEPAYRFFNGQIDDARLYARSLSAAEIATDYNNQSSPGTFYTLGTQATSSAGQSASENIVVGTSTYNRYFYVSDVYRTGGVIVSSGGAFDPSTKLVTVVYTLPSGSTSSIAAYLTRHGDRIYDQTDWGGGAGVSGPVTSTGNAFATSTNIDYATMTGSVYINIPGY